MFRSFFGGRLQSLFARPSRPVQRRTRLGIDKLEDRDVPALMTVNSLSDTISANNVLTLREAMSVNNGSLLYSQLSAAEKSLVAGTIGSNDRIQFTVNGTINLNSDLPSLNKKLTIEGPGANLLTINGNAARTAITVGVNGDGIVSGLRLYNCFNTDSGGAAINNGKLSFSRIDFEANNTDKHGAAIENNGTLVVNECYFHLNQADLVGGCIDNNANATVANSTFAGNFAGNNGGALWSDGALTIVNSTFVGNRAANYGGALRLTDGTVTITSSTFTGNDCDTDNSGFESGGAISNDGATLTINNSVVAQNLNKNKTVKDDIAGIVSGQFNFIGVNTGLTGITNGTNNNRVGTNASPLDPMLLALGDNGGFAPTKSPTQGSPLVGTGAPTALAGIEDQRGAGRSGAITIGALQIACPLSPVGVPTQIYGPGPINSADEAFVKGLYRATLLRDADPVGLANWLAILNGNPQKRSEVVHGFYNSYENRSNQVKFYYNYFLGREADDAGLASWVGQLQAGVDEAVVVRGFALSDEFTGKNNNTQFVSTLYFALLGRNADPAGFESWKGNLDNGALTRAQEIDLFLRSTETVQRVATSYYESYLNSLPSAGQLDSATAAIQSGFSFGSVAEIVLGSAEFYNNAAQKVGS